MTTFKKRVARLRRKLFNGQSPAVAKGGGCQANRYFYLGSELAMVRLNCGHMLYVDPLDEHVSANIIAHGHWEASVHKALLRLVRPGFRIIEVGANIGYYTVTMAGAVGPNGFVTAFDGNPRLIGLVQRSLLLNGYAQRARLIPKAALDLPSQIDFVISRRNSGGGYVSLWNENPYEDGQTLSVEAVRIDDQELGQADLIRIDAEGSEPFILRGAEQTLRANPDIILCLEWSIVQMGSRTSVPDFVNWLDALGFGFWRIETDSSLTPLSKEQMSALPNCDVIAARHPLTT
ncbi:FkbM family methyltransferase [Brevundimonas sp.]|uniref:FkbM family methyltransferase n=1 Tax=Brevundimonas sp. TaxID=1871086 RepID=UPI0028A9FB0C|nr:FkbM family methyltransferase [Brevundimonas sp.]